MRPVADILEKGSRYDRCGHCSTECGKVAYAGAEVLWSDAEGAAINPETIGCSLLRMLSEE